MDTPYITFDARAGLWQLEREFIADSKGHQLVVPGGFRFDLASIPRPLWNLIAPFELSIAAPLVHDWLYEHGGMIVDRCTGTDCVVTFTRADADGFLLDLMTQEGVAWWRRQAAYRAVRLFGGGCWTAAPTASTSTSSST